MVIRESLRSSLIGIISRKDRSSALFPELAGNNSPYRKRKIMYRRFFVQG
jgi:hypothetical protein